MLASTGTNSKWPTLKPDSLLLIITGTLHFPVRTIKACRLFGNPYTRWFWPRSAPLQDIQIQIPRYDVLQTYECGLHNVLKTSHWKANCNPAMLKQPPVFKTEGKAGIPQLQWRQRHKRNTQSLRNGLFCINTFPQDFFFSQYAYNHKEIQGQNSTTLSDH